MRLHVTLRTVLAAVAAALAVVLVVPAQPAWAHARLVKSDPADGATVSAPLTAVTFTFTEMVKQQFSTVTVTGADGATYSDGTPKSVDKTLTQPIKALPHGAVRVVWRTASVDGHTIEGQFTFTNTAPAPTSAAPTSAPATTTSTPAVTPTAAAPAVAADPAADDTGSSGLPWVITGAVALALVLAGGAVWWRRRTPRNG